MTATLRIQFDGVKERNLVDFDNAQPIWMQLVEEFTGRIVSGTWQPGERVPSVRRLALELSVNPNTVQKAFAELDREGLTSSERTAGRRVTTDEERIRLMRTQLASGIVSNFVSQLRSLGIDHKTAIQLVEANWQAVRKGTNG